MERTMLDAVQEEIIAEFAMFPEWLDKYDYLIELGNSLPPIDPAHRTEQYAITGCQSRVWVDARLECGGDTVEGVMTGGAKAAGEATGGGAVGGAGEGYSGDRDCRVYFSADSDAIITKGIISLLVRVLNGRTPKEILDTDLYFIDRIGLRENLSPTRANGLGAMIKQMRMYALAFSGGK